MVFYHSCRKVTQAENQHSEVGQTWTNLIFDAYDFETSFQEEVQEIAILS